VLGVVLGKKMPPKSGGDGHFRLKGGAKLRRSLRWCGGGLGLFRRFWRPFCAALGGVWVFLRTFGHGHFASRKCSRKGGNA